jgi:hypothetical protein
MRRGLFRIVALSVTMIAGVASVSAGEYDSENTPSPPGLPPGVYGGVAKDVTNDLSGLGKALTIPAYARGAAMEVKGVVELKRQHRTETSTESRPRHFGAGHRAH